MFPFELSLVNIALTAGISVMILLYAIFIVKLKPQKETEITSNVNFEKKRKNKRRSKEIERPIKVIKTKRIAMEASTPPAKIESVPEQSVESVQRELSLESELTQKKKEIDEKRAFLLFGKRDFEGCSHKFGYLKNLPKNTPIPNECFGCPQILECLMPPKKK